MRPGKNKGELMLCVCVCVCMLAHASPFFNSLLSTAATATKCMSASCTMCFDSQTIFPLLLATFFMYEGGWVGGCVGIYTFGGVIFHNACSYCIPLHCIQGLLVKDPAKRLGSKADDALAVQTHPFFANIDWNALVRREVCFVIGERGGRGG